MAYNASYWFTQKIENFQLPLEVLNKIEGIEIDINFNAVEAAFFGGYCELFEVQGKLDDNNETITVNKIYYGSERSGRNWETFIELLKKSTGILQAIIFWEGEDIYKLTAINGTVTDTQIDLMTL